MTFVCATKGDICQIDNLTLLVTFPHNESLPDNRKISVSSLFIQNQLKFFKQKPLYSIILARRGSVIMTHRRNLSETARFHILKVSSGVSNPAPGGHHCHAKFSLIRKVCWGKLDLNSAGVVQLSLSTK